MNNSDMPAMPIPHQIIDANHEHFKIGSAGLTKREHFAAMAMQGLASTVVYRIDKFDELALDAVELANALLKALESEG